MATKESLCIVIDNTASMRSDRDGVCHAVREMVLQKIFHSKQDVVGLVLHGTEGTSHGVAEDDETVDGQYPHITEVHKMAPVSCRTLAAINDLDAEQPSHSADLVDSLLVGMFAVIRHARKLKFLKRVLLITDGTSRCTVDDNQLKEVAGHLRSSEVKVEVFGVGSFDLAAEEQYEAEAEAEAGDDDAEDADAFEDDDTTPLSARQASARRAHTCAFLNVLEQEVGKELFGFTKLSDAVSMIEALQKRSVRSTTTFRGALAIGASLGLPVWSWKKVVPASAPTMKTVSKSSLDGLGPDDDPTSTATTERRYFTQSAPDEDVAPQMTLPGYRFGKDLVPVAGADAEKIKYGVDAKLLQTIGVMPQEELPRHLMTGTAECVFSDPKEVGEAAHKAMQALLIVLEEEGLVAIARYAPRKGASPRLVALWPAIRSFWMVGVPFADELKCFDWGPPSAVPPPKPAQVAAAHALIDAMELCPEEEGGESDAEGASAAEPLLPKHVFNPKLRRFNQCIASRALATLGGGGASSLLPVADERVTKPLIPDAALLSRAAPAIDAFAEACPLGVSTSGTKRKAAPIDGASGTPARKSQAQGIGEEGTDGFVADGSAAPMMLTSVVPSEIDSGNLISSFTMMLGDPKVDRTAAAFEGISNAIVDLLAACSSRPEDAHAEKALTALRAFRDMAVQHEWAACFNTRLMALKAEYANGPRSDVWARIVRDAGLKHGLITYDECDKSTTTEAQAAAFWTVDAAAGSPARPAPPTQHDDDDDVLDDMD